MKKFNYFIESFVEKYNGIIQILLLAVVILANCLIVRDGQFSGNENDIISLFKLIITLIIGVILEIILLQIKDSSTQRKINGIGEVVRELAKREDMWREETNLEPFFNVTKKDFFISGIINDKLIIKYLRRIEELLDKGVNVKILIESFEELDKSVKFLYGQDYNRETSLSLLKDRLNNTLINLRSLDRLEDYFSDGLLQIGLSKAPFINPSIIAYDYKGSAFETRRTELSTAPEMSVRFYMQGVDGPTSHLKTHPTLLINSNIMAKEYDDFVKEIRNEWEDSTQIKTIDDFNKL